uniref:Glia maturation factor gamma n=1 Tax=Oryzias sinensis TaxID=183150 RepID=A0A8C7YZY2_9TELE
IESLVVCDVDEDLVKKLRQFRFRKETNNAAIVSERGGLSARRRTQERSQNSELNRSQWSV